MKSWGPGMCQELGNLFHEDSHSAFSGSMQDFCKGTKISWQHEEKSFTSVIEGVNEHNQMAKSDDETVLRKNAKNKLKDCPRDKEVVGWNGINS